jgi:hypothetical protein
MIENSACVKCGHISEKNKKKYYTCLCAVCNCFAPKSKENFEKYIEEKIDGKNLESFRKYANTRGEQQKEGMIEKASEGKLMSRVAFGYKLENKNLVASEDSKTVEEIFKEFLDTNISLNQLSKKYGLSVNGTKKILSNFTYLGRIKFNSQIHEGHHPAIISSTLFNHVQNKLEKLGIKIR